MNHFGFSPEDPIQGKSFEIERTEDEKVFVLLRDAKQMLVSNWYFIRANKRVSEKLNKLYPGSINSLHAFLRSPLATTKFSNFLRKIQDLKEAGCIGDIFFYEDIYDYQFIKCIPSILGVDNIISEDLAKQIHQDSLERVNTFGTDHSAAKKEDLEWIDFRLNETCELEEYRTRYLL